MRKKTKFHISGLHCRSCKTLIESELEALPGIKSMKVDYQNGAAEVDYNSKEISLQKIQDEIIKLNYGVIAADPGTATSKHPNPETQVPFIKKHLPLLVLPPALLLGYVLINQLGLMETMARLNDNEISIFLIFIIGFLASFHCVGMCGGLIVSYSAQQSSTNKPAGSRSLPHLQYNLGRLISYTLVGAVLGGFGSFFAINPNFTGFITVFAGAFMLLLGLSLLTNHRALEAIKLKTPDFIAKFIYRNKHSAKPKGPFVIGLLTAFMPCGPLQAMQLFALATGSVLAGALAMAVYALGTIPVLFGFGHIISMLKQTKIAQMVKISGAIVIVLGLMMINRGLINFDLGLTGLWAGSAPSQTGNDIYDSNSEFQTINMDLTYSGYSPNVLPIRAGIPVRWVINVKQMSGCTDAIMIESLGIKRDLVVGENIIEFTPPAGVSEIKFSCWMRMVWGKFVITDNNQSSNNGVVPGASAKTEEAPTGSTCAGGGSCGNACCQTTCTCGPK